MGQIKAVIEGRDELMFSENEGLKAIGCKKMMTLFKDLQALHGKDPKFWPLQKSQSHQSLLINELILKSKNVYKLPYSEEEICHCRSVATESVTQAIKAGAHTIEAIRATTDANTACGTCGPDVESVLKYILEPKE